MAAIKDWAKARSKPQVLPGRIEAEQHLLSNLVDKAERDYKAESWLVAEKAWRNAAGSTMNNDQASKWRAKADRAAEFARSHKTGHSQGGF